MKNLLLDLIGIFFGTPIGILIVWAFIKSGFQDEETYENPHKS